MILLQRFHKNSIVFLVLFFATILAPADIIELKDGTRINDIKRIAIRNGTLYYRQKGQTHTLSLNQIKHMKLTSSTPDTPDVDIDAPEKLPVRDTFRFSVSIDTEKSRVHEPLVRVYYISQDERGERTLFRAQNIKRADDPSSLIGVPEVAAKTYREQAFEIQCETIRAFRIEVWINGELAAVSGDKNIEPEHFWWNKEKVKTAKMTVLENYQKKSKAPPYQIEITRVSLRPSSKNLELITGLAALSFRGERNAEITVPKITLYYVIETTDQKRVIKKTQMKFEDEEKEITLINGFKSMMATAELGDDVSITRGAAAFKKDKNHIVHTRVEVTLEDEIIALDEDTATRQKLHLPENWYE